MIATEKISDPFPVKVRILTPLLISQRVIALLTVLEMIYLLSGVITIESTMLGSLKVRITDPLSISHSMIVLLRDTETICFPSGAIVPLAK